ncbi:MAG TPA: flagellar basal body L-ring protein FlgH [Gemmatimonadales bacterium]|nr:flagellar basal body L-ring protein FlgH [Gemmatimonadales bacterium]
MTPMRGLPISLVLLVAVRGLAAQNAPAAPSTTAAAPAATPPAVQAAPAVVRAGWFSDKRPLRVGDLVMIVVDEAVNSRESQTENASKSRGQQMGLNLTVGEAVKIGPQKGFESGLSNDSKATGVANRTGGLTATISVRVVSIEPSGIAKLKGEKTVGVDGRNQVIQVEGVVRPEDVNSDNSVYSSRIAESVITYKGKKIGPGKGILGGILSIFWP